MWQLGDLIDGSNSDRGQSHVALEATIKQVLQGVPCAVCDTVGNHELMNFSRAELGSMENLGFTKEWYSAFEPCRGWRAITLDSYQISVLGWPEDDPRLLEAQRLLAANNPNDLSGKDWMKGLKGDARRFVPFNGGFGSEQLEWLRGELRKAAEASERVVIMSHAVLSPRACDGTTMAWDYKEALDVVHASGVVAAVVCGHDHKGGYHLNAGVHHLTLRSPLNEPASEAFGVLRAYRDRLEIRGPNLQHLLPYGKVDGRSEADSTLLSLSLKPYACGPTRVLLLRHGESLANAAADHNIGNPRLSALGRDQARAWAGKLGSLGIECVLVSPLLRAVETAALALAGLEGCRMELCRHARELYWNNAENTLGGAEEVRALLSQYNIDMGGVSRAFEGDSREEEHTSIADLRAVLRGRTEQTVLIVCHWGVIDAMCGEQVENGVLVECERNQVSGELLCKSVREYDE